MIKHTIYTMTFNRFCEMHKRRKISYASRLGFITPKILSARWANDLFNFAREILQGDKGDLLDEYRKRKISNLVNNYLPAMYNALMWTDSSEIKGFYKDYFGKDFENINDLKAIQSEISKLTNQYNSLFSNDDDLPEKEIDFEEILFSIEISLGIPINRKEKLYKFESYYKKALEVIQSTKKQLKKHG